MVAHIQHAHTGTDTYTHMHGMENGGLATFETFSNIKIRSKIAEFSRKLETFRSIF